MKSCLILVLIAACCAISSIGTLFAQDPVIIPTETPIPDGYQGPDTGYVPTIILAVCKDGARYVFSYSTEQDFASQESALEQVEYPYQYGIPAMFYADPSQRTTFSVPAAAMTWQQPTDDAPFVSYPRWRVDRSSGEFAQVDVTPDTPDCKPKGKPDKQPHDDTPAGMLPIGQKVIAFYDGEERVGEVRGYFDPASFDPPLDIDGMGYKVHFDEMAENSDAIMERSQLTVTD